MANDQDYVDLGISCADICRALDRGMNGKRLNDLSQPVREAINQLTAWVKPAPYTLGGSLTEPLVAELLRRSREGSSNTVNATTFPGSSVRGMTETQLLLGDRNSTGSFTSSTCVQRHSLGYVIPN